MIKVGKIVPVGELRTQLLLLPRPLVMTNGVFDLLHRGHVSYLNAAAKLGQALVVGLNSDVSVRLQGKGPDRPLNPENDRAYVLASLTAVDCVTLFDNLTPIELVRLIRPDIYVKGGDYEIDKLDEAKLVQSWGGTACTIPYLKGFSSTALINRIRKYES